MSDATSSRTISRSDIESKFREVQQELTAGAEKAKSGILAAAAVGAVVLLLLTFIMGRRAGKRKSTVVEIRRL